MKSPSDRECRSEEPGTDAFARAGDAGCRLVRNRRALVAAALICSLFWSGLCLSPPRLFRMVNHKIYDSMHHGLPVSKDAGMPAIVDIDEKSLAEIGQWPWPRYVVSRLLTRIQDMDAAAVGLDIVFAESDRTSVHIVERDLSREVRADVRIIGVPDNYRDNDRILADTLAAGPFVLGYPFFYDPKPIPDTGVCDLHPVALSIASTAPVDPEAVHLPHARDVTPNLPEFCEAAPASGFINASPDEDGVLRKIGMVTRYRGRFYPGLGLATFLEATGARNLFLQTTRHTPEFLRMTVAGRPLRIPLDRDGHLLIRHYGGPGSFESIPASDILLGRVPAKTLAGRIVFVGSSAPALSDVHPTPLHPLVPGIEIQASVVRNMLARDFVARPWWTVWAESALVLLAGLCATLLLLWRRSLIGFLLTVFLGAGLWFGSHLLLVRGRLFLSPQFPVLAMVGIFCVATLIKFLGEEAKNREQTEMLLKAQELTLHSLASLAETRDNETGNHLLRTQEYIRILAEYLSRKSCGYAIFRDPENVVYLYKSAPLHDIGKVGIPDRILLKPARLDPAEFEVMKQHARYGRDALVRAEERLETELTSPYFRFARDVVFAHHEQWSGGGYPLGLAGEQIPPAGRLMAMADVYDALRSQRVYKPAFSHAKTRGIIVSGRGTHFDPEVVDAFLALEGRFVEIAEQYADPEEEADAAPAVEERNAG